MNRRPFQQALLLLCFVLAACSLQAQEPLLSPAGSQLRAGLGSTPGVSHRAAATSFLAQRGIGVHGFSYGTPGPTPAEMLFRARVQRNALRARAADTGANVALSAPWTAAGPQQAQTKAFGLVTGRVTSLAVDSSDASGNTVYLGTTGGGIWKSKNAAGSPSAVTFLPLTDGLPGENTGTGNLTSLSIGALSVQPRGTKVILAGTGDPNDALDSYYGNGILRSEDSGNSWSLTTQSSDADYGPGQNFSFFGLSFSGFAWSADSPNLVIAAVSSSLEGAIVNAGLSGSSAMGLYYSQDAGKTWQMATITNGPQQVLQGPNTNFTSFSGNAVTSVVWNGVRHTFYAAVRRYGYYQSTDGITWTRIQNQPGSGLNTTVCPARPGQPGSMGCPIFRGALTVQPVTGDTFAITTNSPDQGNTDQGLYRDVCGFTSGNCVSSTVTFGQQLPSGSLEVGGGNKTIPLADYNLWLKAIPSGGDTLLFAGTQDIFRCSLATNCTWRNATNVSSCAAAQVAPSQHAVDWVPGASTLYFGNDGGVWRTTDGIAQQPSSCSSDDANHFQNLNGGLGSLTELTSLAQDPVQDTVMLAGAGASGSLSSLNGSQYWQQAETGLGRYAAIDPNNSENWYVTSGAAVGISRCTAGAACDTSGFGASPVIGNGDVDNDGSGITFPAVWMLDPQNSANLLVATCRMWRGPATGGWSQSNAISPMLDGKNAPYCQGNAQVRSLAASGMPNDPGGAAEWVYAGMAGLFDGGATGAGHLYSQTVSPGTTASTKWNDLYLSPVTNDSNNRGQFNPGDFAISSITTDPHDATGKTVYAVLAGFSGSGLTETVSQPLVYASTDAGQHWLNITSNLPDAPVNAVLVDPNNANILYVGTDVGVYITSQVTQCGQSGAQCWNLYGTGLPDVPIVQLVPFTGGGETLLRAATYGRGVWQVQLASQSATQGATTSAAASPAALAFGDQAVSTVGAYQSITVTNIGSNTMTISGISVPGDFVKQSTTECPASLPANSSCTIHIAFAPTATGPRSGTLTISANVSGGQLTVALTGNGTPSGPVVLTPTSLSFGSILVGAKTSVQYLTIANMSNAMIGLKLPAVSGPFVLTANTCGATLNASFSCTVGVVFAPASAGLASGFFSITDDAGTQVALLSGTGLTGATDMAAPTSLSFGPQLINTTSVAQTVTLTNNGDSPLQLITTFVTGDFTATNLCGSSLAGHSSCAVQVTYSPKNLGAESGVLTIQDTKQNGLSAQTIALSGTGLAPAGIPSLAPGNLDFGVEGLNHASAAKVITVTNNTRSAISGLQVQVNGDFSAQSNTCGVTLAPGTACTVGVVFTPSQTGARSGTLTASSSSLATPLVSNLTGTGVEFQIVVVGSATQTVVGGKIATFMLRITPVGASNGSIAMNCAGMPSASACSFDKSSFQLVPGADTIVIVSVATGAQSAASRVNPFRLAEVALGCLLPLGWGLRRYPRVLSTVLLAMISLGAVGCGLTINGGKKAASPTPGSGAGSYTLTVTGAAPDVQHAVTLTLNVE